MADTSKLAKADIKGGARVATKGAAKAAAAAAEGEDYAPTGLDDRFQTTGTSASQLILCVRWGPLGRGPVLGACAGALAGSTALTSGGGPRQRAQPRSLSASNSHIARTLPL